MLETQVVDTGVGIEPFRQSRLFKSFAELKHYQNFKQVPNFTSGMGLACSHTIVRAMGGDIVLKQSAPGLTEFAFKVPIIGVD